jgi:hypothetical protein
LSTFEQCEAKYDFLYVTRNVKDTDNEWTTFGTRVHEALEKAGRASVGTVVDQAVDALSEEDYPVEVRPHLELVRRIVAQPGTKYFEVQVAITKDFKQCEWFAPDVWMRGILDVLVVNGKRATVIDWKTGKVRDNPTQLQLFAALVFILFPEVEEVKTAFVWLQHGQITESLFQRRNATHLWNALLPRFKRVEDAVIVGVFKARPSNLCRWCAAKDVCKDARR